MKRVLSGLLKRSSELPTALEIKNSNWNIEDSLDLIKRVQKSRKPYSLHEDTISILQSHLQSYHCPLSRYQGLKELSKLGSLDPTSEASMHAHFNEFEQAIAEGYIEQLDDTKLKALISHGASEEAASLVLSTNYPLPPFLWNQLIQQLITSQLYDLAKNIWFCKPRMIVPHWTVRQLFILGAKVGDLEMLAELEPLIPNKPDKVLQTYLIDAMDDVNELLKALRKQGTGGGSLLAQNVMSILPQLQNEPTELYNSILKGCFDSYTSLFVFAIYQYLLTTGLRPDMETAQILANACHRLGNSKLVSYSVWNEFINTHGLEPTRKFCETMVQCQFNGIGAQTSLFYLSQMHKRAIFLRNNLHFQLLGVFGSDLTYTQLYGDMRKLQSYSEWDHNLAQIESGKYAAQAQRNYEAFKSSKTLEDIERMLKFEHDRLAEPVNTT